MNIGNTLITPIIDLGYYEGNHLYIKREDFIPFSFGGNKARKARLFFQQIDDGDYSCVVTYGSGNSNHCRIIANECCRRGMECYIISPKEVSGSTFNRKMMQIFGAKIITVPVSEVHNTIEAKLEELKKGGEYPYLIEGGGHGNIGTEAYVQCYQEIKEQESKLGIYFDYIFFASGTGTTHAGLVSGQLLSGDERRIVGISIARKNPRGINVVLNSVSSYLCDKVSEKSIRDATVFIDDYTTGYGKYDRRVVETIEMVLKTYGIPLDTTYTGKAFMGMTDYIKGMKGKNILFIHTGGTPLFFDSIKQLSIGGEK